MRLRSPLLAFVLAPLVVAGCTRPCKDGTALVTVTLGSGVQGADALTVTVIVDGTQKQMTSVRAPSGGNSGTIEIDFATYPKGSTVEVDVTATAGGAALGSGKATTTLSGSCGNLEVSIGTSGPPPDLAVVPVASIVPKPDYVGFPSTIDGSGSTDGLGQSLTYAWTLVQPPTGSTVTQASLMGANTSKVTFNPDLGGTYKVSLTVTASDGRTGTSTADVVVPTWPIYFSFGTGDTMTTRQIPTVIRSDGTGEKAIACPLATDAGFTGQGSQRYLFPLLFAAGGGRAWSPATGTTGTLYYTFWSTPDLINLNSSTFQPQLFVGSEATGCGGTAPVRIDSAPVAGLAPVLPRPSPNGKRVAYIEANTQGTGNGTYAVVTVASDGSGQQNRIRGAASLNGVAPFWIDDTHLMWVETRTNTATNSTIQVVVSATDANGAGTVGDSRRTELLVCDQGVSTQITDQINEAVKTPFGLVIGTYGSGGQILLVQPGDCTKANARAIADETGGRPYNSPMAGDFDLSPDGTLLVFSSTLNSPQDGGSYQPRRLFLATSDGTTTPQPFVPASTIDQVGPFFIAGGRQIVWSELNSQNISSSRIMMANRDGTRVKVLRENGQAGDLGPDVVFAGANTVNCTYGDGSATGGILLIALAFALAGGLVLLARRRSRG